MAIEAADIDVDMTIDMAHPSSTTAFVDLTAIDDVPEYPLEDAREYEILSDPSDQGDFTDAPFSLCQSQATSLPEEWR